MFAGLTLFFALAFVHAIVRDFLKTFLDPPSHMRRKKGWSLFRRPAAQVPLVALEGSNDYRMLLARGSQMYPNQAYKIFHFPGELVIIPHQWIDEIKNAPSSTLSFQQGSWDLLLGTYTGISGHETAVASLIRSHMGHLLNELCTVVDSEGKAAIEQHIGPCKGWTPILLLPRVVQIVTTMTQRVFAGESLCRDPKWVTIALLTQGIATDFKKLEAVVNCAAGFRSVAKLWQTNWFLRSFVAWRDKSLKGLRNHRKIVKRLLLPVLDERLKSMENPLFKPPTDLIQLLIDTNPQGIGRSIGHHTDAQINTGRAALFTTSISTFHLVYDLAAHPECIEPLRQELAELGDVAYSEYNVSKLVKLDSFIRECQRWSSLTMIGTIRSVMQPFMLPDGTVLPVGTILGVNAHDSTFNNSPFENPHVFDGFRFAKLRAASENKQIYQATTPTADHLVFGYGVQKCPGRFFAMHQIKITLLRVILAYDLKLKNPAAPSPMSKASGLLTTADQTTEILFRSRT